MKMTDVVKLREFPYHKTYSACLVWCREDNKYHLVDVDLIQRTGRQFIVHDDWMTPTYSYMNAINFYEQFVEDFKRTYNCD